MNRFFASPLKHALGAALALALTVNPVAAGHNHSNSNDDTAAILGALLGLATIGVLLSNNNDDDKYKGTRKSRDYRKHVRKPTPRVRKVPADLHLPANCVRKYRTQQGVYNHFRAKCLKRKFQYASSLPRACRDTIVAKDGKGIYRPVKVYRAGCLHQRGYRTKAHY